MCLLSDGCSSTILCRLLYYYNNPDIYLTSGYHYLLCAGDCGVGEEIPGGQELVETRRLSPSLDIIKNPKDCYGVHPGPLKIDSTSLLASFSQTTMNMLYSTFLLCTVLLVLFPSPTLAFGAGEIPDFAYLNGEISILDDSIIDWHLISCFMQQTRHFVMGTSRTYSRNWLR